MSHKWQNVLVSPSKSIQDVLSVIDKEHLRIALVVDNDNSLLGTVTDGDIRRALINKISFEEPISKIMCSTPTTVDVGTPRAKILEIMEEKELFLIPLLDNGIVVGLETVHRAIQKNKYDNPVFLMAGGFGTRLQPLTNNCPKPLLKVGDKPILETLLLQFINAGFHNFFISTHYLPEMIREYFGNGSKWDVVIKYVHEQEPLGTGGALGLLPNDIPDVPVIMINGDVLTTINIQRLLAFHNHKGGIATMCVREYEYQVPFGVVENNGTELLAMTEKPIHRYRVNAGIYVVEPSLIAKVKSNEYIDMPTLLEKNMDHKVHLFTFHEYWLDIGRIDDFNRAQQDYENLGLFK